MNVPDVTLQEQDLQLNPYDVTLLVKDGKEFKAHRQVLSEASPFFEALLRSDMKEKKEGVIRLEMFNESQMADILEFIYTGNVKISAQENAKNLIAVADYLCLSNLKHIAGKFLEQNLTTLNCFSTLHLAEEYLCNDLTDSTRKVISSNFAVLAETEEFMKLPSHEVEKWISSDEIAISGEEDVFETVLRWIDHDKSERSAKFSDMFRHVRLTFLSRDYLLSHVVTNDLVKDNKDCLNGATEALAWIDRELIEGDWDVSRPHPPRKALEVSVIVVCGSEVPFRTLVNVPEENEFYSLPERAKSGRYYDIDTYCEKQLVFSCRGKLFIVPCEIGRAQCFIPELNRWTPSPL